ncbi:serine/threonine protein kinase [Bacillus suaedaesalsae]|uniref:Serine/threonine-protein kinase n=1 Tax=Bacillus suaedaesalsae TaxID=2810349 RepID=A0ABS2DLX2_9BACI|nr:protein kinase [Bacillus suaedaesalsae]MBM6619491.1 serine/threonine-protein kinase [Bacillus suaedaesalsae]
MVRNFIEYLLERPLKKGVILQCRYEIIDFVGMGSYGIVYLALDLDTSKLVIIKQNRRKREKLSKALLKKEAQTLHVLLHPHIPKCIDFVEEASKSTLIMEHMEGKNFEELVLVTGKIYNENESLRILQKVVEVVEYIHSKNIVHRDLRLPNILFHNDEVFIIDFGLAVFQHETENITSTLDASFEKRLYREPLFESDFYALGHFLLFLLYSGYEPSSRKEKSWEDELAITNNTRSLLRKLLKIDKPYKSCRALLDDLQVILSKA